ncbi:MAG: RNA polymerase subunit sigma-70 [Planctomycetaceae bacterium]|nr:RNA polymerase subunit sigma-70 [Planctomycetaceae bacterium]
MTDDPVQDIGPHHNTSTGWLERVRAGEPSAWQTFVRLYGPLIYHWCQRSGLQAADAADVGQDVFRAVLIAIPQFQREADGSFRGWLRVITRNKVRDFLRERTRVPGAGGDIGNQLASVAADPTPGEVIDPEEERILYRRALELVLAEHRDDTRQAFLRVVIDRQDPAAVASDLGLTVNAIYLAKSRILRRLREEFAGLLEPQSD